MTDEERLLAANGALVIVGSFLAGASLSYSLQGRPAAAVPLAVLAMAAFACSSPRLQCRATRAWRRLVVGRAQVYSGRAYMNQTPQGVEARAPSHVVIPPGYHMRWRGVEVDGQVFVHYEVRPSPGLRARWMRLRYPSPVDRRPDVRQADWRERV